MRSTRFDSRQPETGSSVAVSRQRCHDSRHYNDDPIRHYLAFIDIDTYKNVLNYIYKQKTAV